MLHARSHANVKIFSGTYRYRNTGTTFFASLTS
jgi:hypothetical protein